MRFEPEKTVRPVTGVWGGNRVVGYEIHHGRVVDNGHRPLLVDDVHGPEGSAGDAVWGTHWHGLLANDAARRALLVEVAAAADRADFRVAPDTDAEAARVLQLDRLADAVDEHLDMAAVEAIIADGPPATASVVRTTVAPSPT